MTTKEAAGIIQKTLKAKLNCGKGLSTPNFSFAVEKKAPDGMALPLSTSSFHATQGRKKETNSIVAKMEGSHFVSELLLFIVGMMY